MPGRPPDADRVVDVDVLIYGTQTAGIAALHELQLALPTATVAVVSGSRALESPLAQGLCLEDGYEQMPVVGFYKEWRDAVIDYYRTVETKTIDPSVRLAYEPEVAEAELRQFMTEGGSKSVFYVGQLLAAGDEGTPRYALIRSESGDIVRLDTTYFIDASVEGDLARLLGADYRVGREETRYNDIVGPRPDYPSPDDNFATAPQRFSALLTLEVYTSGSAPRIADLVHPSYDPRSFYALPPLNQQRVDAFASSWSMTVAVLPNGRREFNETWNDWPDDQTAFAWVFHPEQRQEIRRRVLE